MAPAMSWCARSIRNIKPKSWRTKSNDNRDHDRRIGEERGTSLGTAQRIAAPRRRIAAGDTLRPAARGIDCAWQLAPRVACERLRRTHRPARPRRADCLSHGLARVLVAAAQSLARRAGAAPG